MPHCFLVHENGDAVGVAVQDIEPASGCSGRVQANGSMVELDVVEEVPLGHKVALRDMSSGDPVVEYGETIGVATADIKAGQHVHVHNLKGQRWA